MFETLRTHIEKKVTLTDKEYEICTGLFIQRKIKRHQFLLHEGDVCKYLAFVTKGCMRQYTIDAKGEEHVVQFAIEDWWVTDQASYLTHKPAIYNIDAIEDSDVLLIDYPSREKLCNAVPKFDRFFRLLLENKFIATDRRISGNLSLSAEEQYLCMLDTYPNIVQRVPQNQIASYLGITPQSLSRIRKELSEKK
jgi:CRP-like cAMP-binding protein